LSIPNRQRPPAPQPRPVTPSCTFTTGGICTFLSRGLQFSQSRVFLPRLTGPAMSFASVRCDSQSSGPVPLPSLGRREKKQPPAGPAKNRAPAVPAEKPLGRAATKEARRPRLAPLCWRLNRSPTRLNPRGPLRQNRRPPGRSPAPHERRARGQSAPSPPRLSRPLR
jgi:hypothetical protein